MWCNFMESYALLAAYVALYGVSTQRKLTQHTLFCCGAVDGSQGTKETLKGLTQCISVHMHILILMLFNLK